MKSYEVIIRLMLAILVGGLIGYEREFNNRPAGFRTHILVCMGSAIVSMIQLYSVQEMINLALQYPQISSTFKVDIGRLGAQVITGVGFLGAGTIIHEKGSVKGLTTAASLWGVACIGLAIGFGYYFLSIASTVFIFIVLVSLKKFEDKLLITNSLNLKIECIDKEAISTEVEDYFKKRRIEIKEMQQVDEDDENIKTIMCMLSVPWYIKGNKIMEELNSIDDIIKVESI